MTTISKRVKGLIASLTVAVFGFSILAVEASAVQLLQSACYQWSAFPNERLRLDVKFHSRLTTFKEKKLFGHPVQTAYSVHGKHVGPCGFNTMVASTGTIVSTPDAGQHLGLDSHASRGDGNFFGNDFCRSITFDCTTDEDSPIPNLWSCQSRNEFDVYHGNSTLRRVDPNQDRRCSIFENGTFDDATAALEAEAEGSDQASGLRAPQQE